MDNFLRSASGDEGSLVRTLFLGYGSQLRLMTQPEVGLKF